MGPFSTSITTTFVYLWQMSTLYLQIFRFKFDLKKWDNLKHAERPKVKGGSYTMGLQTANTPDENTPDF